MTSQFPHPARRVREYLRTIRLLTAQTRNEVFGVGAQLSAGLDRTLAGLEDLREQSMRHAAEVDRLGKAVAEVAETQRAAAAERARLLEALRFTHTRSAGLEAQLAAARGEDSYEEAFSESEPLVSVVIATYDNHVLLRERALPSALAQTYPHLEIIVVGDAAPREAEQVVRSFNDPRLRFHNLPYRGPYPTDPVLRWMVAGVPPHNAAVRLARGRWIAPLDDDDAFAPDHVARLLDHARARRLELAFGLITEHHPTGTRTLGRFPPELGQFGLQASIHHGHVARIFPLELADAVFGLPYDWGVCLRMMEAGVRIGMVEHSVVDYYPSRVWTPRFQEPGADAQPPEKE